MTNVRKTDDKYQIFIVCLYLTMFFRAGINEGIDVSIYAKPSIPWQEMKEIKEQLIEEKENEKRTQKLKSRKLNKFRSI